MPHLDRQGTATRLIVDGKPFLIRGGELGNSSFTSLEYMASVWPKLRAMNLNTLLVPVYWELIEPEEGRFDWALLDELMQAARERDFRLVLLWFASYKNSMSSHVPAWVKLDQDRFPRAQDDEGISQEILTPFSGANLEADKRAFVALMEHVEAFNREERTVIMVQPENEIGMLPTARDHHPLADRAFAEAVPRELLDYLTAHRDSLVPEFRARWEAAGGKKRGTWEEVFGAGSYTEEIFMAWYFAKYVNAIASAGKEAYPLPMYANAALNAPGREPGDYPSAGPLPHLMDVWKAAGKGIDFLAPDFYNPRFKHWNDLYTRQGDPLFVPEHRFDSTVAAKAAYVFGHYQGIGFSPFSIESTERAEEEELGKLYALVEQLAPQITAAQGSDNLEGVLLDKTTPDTTLTFGPYTFTVKHSYTLGWEAGSSRENWPPGAAIFVRSADNEWFVLGSGIVVTFDNQEEPELRTGILRNEEGRFADGEWKVIRYMNGDQIHQGRHIAIYEGDWSIQRLELYDYR